MDEASTGQPPLGQYRDYLAFLARVQLPQPLRGKVDPSDVVQEALLRAIQSFHQLNGETEGELRAWLRQILANTLIDHCRAYSARIRNIPLERTLERALADSSARLEECLRDSADGPEAIALKEERLDQLARAINALPDDQRTAVEQYYIHGLKLAKIGQQMGRSTSAVSGLVVRGVAAIRKRMAEDS